MNNFATVVFRLFSNFPQWVGEATGLERHHIAIETLIK